MSVKWISYIWDKTDYRDGSALVALALADFANDEGYCYPKMETVAKKARLSVRQVQRIVKAFELDGFLKVVRKIGRGKEPVFHLQKVTSVTPFKDREKVTSVTPISEIKGDICDTEKVTSVTFPIYKEEPSIEPSLGGKVEPPPPAPETAKIETQTDYLIRKQFEFPNLDVQAVFKRYIAHCKANRKQPKRPFFDSWLENEFEPLTEPTDTTASDIPTVDEVIKKREKERSGRTFAAEITM